MKTGVRQCNEEHSTFTNAKLHLPLQGKTGTYQCKEKQALTSAKKHVLRAGSPIREHAHSLRFDEKVMVRQWLNLYPIEASSNRQLETKLK
jgi:hypothetical protein